MEKKTTQNVSQRPPNHKDHTRAHEFHSIRYSLFIPSRFIYSVLFKVRDFHCRCCCCLLCVTHLLLLSFIRSCFYLFFRCNIKFIQFFFCSFHNIHIHLSYLSIQYFARTVCDRYFLFFSSTLVRKILVFLLLFSLSRRAKIRLLSIVACSITGVSLCSLCFSPLLFFF